VVDFPDQEKMVLTADIKYKGNGQQDGMRAKRRNKWICALKTALAELKIFGPTGDPKAKPAPKPYTIVPWEKVQEDERKTTEGVGKLQSDAPVGGWRLSDRNAIVEDSENIFGDRDELQMPIPHHAQRSPPRPTVATPTTTLSPFQSSPEFIEMSPRP